MMLGFVWLVNIQNCAIILRKRIVPGSISKVLTANNRERIKTHTKTLSKQIHLLNNRANRMLTVAK